MSWQNFNFEENLEEFKLDPSLSPDSKTLRANEKQEQKEKQLKRCLDPEKDATRRAKMSLVSRFVDLLLQDKKYEIIEELLTEDCKTFLFCSREGIPPVKHGTGKEDFGKLLDDIKITEIRVRESYADAENNTVFQICTSKVTYPEDVTVYDEILFNVFTTKEDKICKLRLSFAHQCPLQRTEDLFEMNLKQKMYAKVKAINHALAGYQPDLKKVASLFNEDTVYRVWRWDDLKCFVFSKQDFATKFNQLEEDYSLKCIIPYEINFDQDQFVVCSYSYDLEKKSTGQKFVWITTCVYAFDINGNLLKISQQGQLESKEEAVVPAELFHREKLREQVKYIFDEIKLNIDWFYKDLAQSTVDVWRLGPDTFPAVGRFKGIDDVNLVFQTIRQTDMTFEWMKVADVFIDQQSPSYDVALVILCGQGTFFLEEFKNRGKRLNIISFCKIAFESGKAIKIYQHFFEVPEPIPSPFDNPNFFGVNIK